MKPPHDEWVQGNSSGPYTSPVTKVLLHTTEGGSLAGACAAYKSSNSWPHLTVECRPGRTYKRCGHIDMDVAARSLKNLKGGVQTNTAGVIQIEIVGYATDPGGIDWAWLGANVVGPICAAYSIPLSSDVVWVSYPQSYGVGAAQRLSGARWLGFRGVLGHQHCPENDHGDPGQIPIGVLLEAASPTPPQPPPEDTLSAAEVEQIVNEIKDSRPFFVHDYDLDASLGPWVIFKQAGTKVWVQDEAMAAAFLNDRVFSDGVWPNGYPKAWPRSKAQINMYQTVEGTPEPPGW